MSKLEHDVISAMERTYNAEKEWFVNGLALLRRHLPQGEGLRFLDMGCGNGEWADRITGAYPGAEVHCLDYAGPHLEAVREKGYEVTDLDLDHTERTEAFVETHREQFDVVTAFEVIEHIFDADAFLGAIHSVLRPGGLLILSTPNVGYISYRLFTMCRGNLPPSEGHHVRFFDQRRLEQICWVNGFTPEESAPFGKGDFYLDRARDAARQPVAAYLLRAVFRGTHFLMRNRHSLVSAGLLMCSSKAPVRPLGLDPTKRAMQLRGMSREEETAARERLKPLLARHFFEEHPALCSFLKSGHPGTL